jgi:CYTH domain-containing protein
MTDQREVEIERKFKVVGFQEELLPPNTVREEMTQFYLREQPGGPERRLRVLRGEKGWVFDYTEKSSTSDPRTRGETKKKLSSDEFFDILGRESDINCHPVRKRRYTFHYKGQKWELDRYHDIELDGEHLHTAEAELKHEDEELVIPPWLRLVEITDRPEFKNRRISELIRLGQEHSLLVSPTPQA